MGPHSTLSASKQYVTEHIGSMTAVQITKLLHKRNRILEINRYVSAHGMASRQITCFSQPFKSYVESRGYHMDKYIGYNTTKLLANKQKTTDKRNLNAPVQAKHSRPPTSSGSRAKGTPKQVNWQRQQGSYFLRSSKRQSRKSKPPSVNDLRTLNRRCYHTSITK